MKTHGRLALIGALVTTLSLAGCSSAQTPPPSETPTGPVTPSPTETVAPTPTASPEDIALPTNCEDIFSADWVARLSEWELPLNDPAITMEPTQIEAGLDLLASSAPRLRCTWGAPGDVGVVTTVMQVTQAQIQSVLTEAGTTPGFACAPVSSVEERCDYFESGSDELGDYIKGEEHVFRGNIWVATGYLNVPIDIATPTYTDGIVAKLWG